MSIKENDRVRVIKAEGELSPLIGASGTVKRIYELGTGDIAAVQIIPDETIAREIFVKLPVENLEKVGPQENRETEIPEGAKQIFKADFEAALKRVTSPDHAFGDKSRDPMAGFLASITTMIVGKEVTEKIFEDQDVIVMTEDELISALWSACNPVSVYESVDKKMSPRKCITVAMTAMISFEEIVGIIFGGSND